MKKLSFILTIFCCCFISIISQSKSTYQINEQTDSIQTYEDSQKSFIYVDDKIWEFLSELDTQWNTNIAFYTFQRTFPRRNPLQNLDDIKSPEELGSWGSAVYWVDDFIRAAEIDIDSWLVLGSPSIVAQETELKLFIIPYDSSWDKKLIDQAGAIRLEIKKR